ncbi:DinB family protein [Pseudonocardia nematodicida]|uniref:DinB family protein n=1 Tax=Pseudonocardia nematodicida TaxID=1206997 RepID=A0ABV1K7M0_9PSEU
MPDDKDALLRYLGEGREAMLWKLDGLDEYGARRPMTPTGTNLLGLVKHLTANELTYFARVFDRPTADLSYLDTFDPWNNEDMWARADEPRQEIVGRYRRVAAHTDAIIAELPLDTLGRVPHWPAERAETTLQHLVVRMIAETHRHAGQADIVREHLDGRAGHRAADPSLPSDEATWWAAHVAEVEAAAREAR